MTRSNEAQRTGTSSVDDLLLQRGSLDPADLTRARQAAASSGAALADVLVSRGLADRADVYRAVADAAGLEYADLSESEVDDMYWPGTHFHRMVEHGWAPVREYRDGTVRVAISHAPGEALRDEITAILRAPVEYVIADSHQISVVLQRHHRDALSAIATYGLWEREPSSSARAVLVDSQKVLGCVVLAGLVLWALLAPVSLVVTLSLAVAFGFSISVAFKFAVCMAGARRETVPDPDTGAAAVPDHELPLYTVLVPCFREENVVGQLVTNLGELDYPAERLQILLLLEETDVATREAALAANPPPNMEIVVVPDGKPRTKPKACNVGLQLARGQYVVIYDAEDKPDPDQLRKAVAAFRRSGSGTVCVQAALNYWNADENVLTRMFTLEYSFWFDYMLAGLDWQNLPIPLGGTSNHFRTHALRKLGGWDPFNVTEDADLGIRAAARGMRVGIIASTTFEEANRATGNWIRQRSRWIKGYIQTLLVHLRHPVRLVRTTGWRQAAGFALLIGGTPLSFLCVPPLYALLVLSIVLDPATLAPLFPGWVLWASLANLFVGNAMMIWVSMMGAFRRRRYRLVLWALLNPAYWLLHSIAAYKAAIQLITKPHYWEKTQHGLSRVATAPHPAPA
jgi:cellulose synthase/poly-beta-1,6-N-acetylglucosamine synthase-like glycosyltransferase